MTGDRDWSAPNHMLDRLNWRYQFDYEICEPVIQLIAISARTMIHLRATPSAASILAAATPLRTFTLTFLPPLPARAPLTLRFKFENARPAGR